METAKLSAERRKAAAAELDNARHDLDFMRAANDIHNLHYASKLFTVLVDRVAGLCREVKVAEPKIDIPPPLPPKNGKK